MKIVKQEAQDQPEQEALTYDNAMMNLQTELHKVQVEKDVLSELRWFTHSSLVHTFKAAENVFEPQMFLLVD